MTREHLFLRELRKLFDLRGDMDEPADIDASIRQGVKIHGTNLWILMFAILVASIGLNVNSTAVIIGAMLMLGKEAAPPAAAVDSLIVYLETRKAISHTTENRIRNWLKARFKLEDVYVFSKPV